MNWKSSLDHILNVDNGAHFIKAQLASQSDPIHIYHALAGAKTHGSISFTLLGNDILHAVEDGSALERKIEIVHPLARGLLYDCDLEVMLWRKIFSELLSEQERSSAGSRVSTRKVGISEKNIDERLNTLMLALSLPCALPQIVSERYTELIFEQFGFDACHLLKSPVMTLHSQEMKKRKLKTDFGMLLQFGHSFSYCIPFYSAQPLTYAIKRVDVGGKLLRNSMCERLSKGDYDLRQQRFLVQEIFERTSRCSLDFLKELRNIKQDCFNFRDNNLFKGYILSDKREKFSKEYLNPQKYSKVLEGVKQIEKVRSEGKHVAVLKNQFLTIPELLFSPSTIGLEQQGIIGAIQQSLESCPDALRPFLLENVIVTGGVSKIQNLEARLKQELEPLNQGEGEVAIHSIQDPMNAPYNGQRAYLNEAIDKNLLGQVALTQKEYQEYGASYAVMKFQF